MRTGYSESRTSHPYHNHRRHHNHHEKFNKKANININKWSNYQNSNENDTFQIEAFQKDKKRKTRLEREQVNSIFKIESLKKLS